MWWMILHHLRRAVTVLLLELSFRAEHMPAEAAELLTEAKAAINWLRQMGASNASAKDAWVTLSRLLYHAAQKVGGDMADTITASEVPAKGQGFNMDILGGGFDFSQAGDLERPSNVYNPDDPNVFPPLGLYGGMPQGTGQYLGDLATINDWDESGFLNAWDEWGGLFQQQQGPGFPQGGQQMDSGPPRNININNSGQGFFFGGQNQPMSRTGNEQNQWTSFSDIGGEGIDRVRG